MCLLMPMHSLANILSLVYEISVVFLSLICNYKALWIYTGFLYSTFLTFLLGNKTFLGINFKNHENENMNTIKLKIDIWLKAKTKWRFHLHEDYTMTKMADQQFSKRENTKL